MPVLASPERSRTAESPAHQAKSSGGKPESPPKQPVAVLNEEEQQAKDTQKTEESADTAEAQDPAATGEEGSASGGQVEGESGTPEKLGDEEDKAGKEIVDETGYENDSFETLETLEVALSILAVVQRLHMCNVFLLSVACECIWSIWSRADAQMISSSLCVCLAGGEVVQFARLTRCKEPASAAGSARAARRWGC